MVQRRECDGKQRDPKMELIPRPSLLFETENSSVSVLPINPKAQFVSTGLILTLSSQKKGSDVRWETWAPWPLSHQNFIYLLLI